MNEAHIAGDLPGRRLLTLLVQQTECTLGQSLSNDLGTLDHVASRPRGKTVSLASGTVRGEQIAIVARNGALGTHNVGRNISQIGGAEGAHELALARQLVGIVFLLQQQCSVAHVVARHEFVGVVHRGRVHSVPVEGTQQIVLLVHEAQLSQYLVHIVIVLGTFLGGIAQIRSG